MYDSQRFETMKLVKEVAVCVCPDKEAERDEIAEPKGANPSRLSWDRRPDKSQREYELASKRYLVELSIRFISKNEMVPNRLVEIDLPYFLTNVKNQG